MCAIHLATCQHLAPRLSLQRLECVLYPLDHPSASDTWDTTEGAITEKVGACLQSIRPLSSIWYLSYHCKGWGMCSICQATREHLILGLSLKKLLGYPLCALSVYPLALFVCLFVWFVNVLVNYQVISRTGPKTRASDNFTCCHT